MNNNIKGINSEEITIQLTRAEVQKVLLIKNIYKEYENYLHIVRKSIFNAAEKGILSLFSDLSISDQKLDTTELSNFINKNISLLIHSKLPFLTIEQLNLSDISYSQKQLVNLKSLRELVEFKEDQSDKSDYQNILITDEPLELDSNNNSKTYDYYESLSSDELSSVDLDERDYLDSFSRLNSNKNIEYKKNANAFLELIEKTTDNKFNYHEKINSQAKNGYILNHNLNFFEFIDKSFSDLLLNLSYEINLDLFKMNLIKKIISEGTFKCLSNNNYIIKHPYPFIIRYDLNPNNITTADNTGYEMYLFNITNIELEFYNLDLSICRNNINQLKNKFKLLNKKQRYWKHKELSLKN